MISEKQHVRHYEVIIHEVIEQEVLVQIVIWKLRVETLNQEEQIEM